MKKFLVILILLAFLGGGAWWLFWPASTSVSYRTAKLERGDLWVLVTATGTVQPVTQVQVGTQVGGTIRTLEADFNSRVTAGMVLAQIDPAPFQARVEQDRANLRKAEADVERVQASLVQAEKELERSRELAKRSLISPSELDAAEATQRSLAAQVKVARASVAQSQAALENSLVNLGYTTIVCPVDGIVISRNVDVGQTVAASLQAPTLFVIAANLKRIQIQASVSEADIGRIFQDQAVTFSVDAYRERKFEGTVSQVRLAPTIQQNVVTYTVIVDAENPDEKLLPGMTAGVSFQVDHAKDALKAPNAALRFHPPSAAAPAQANGGRRDRKGPPEAESGRLWVREGDEVKEIRVKTGITDGSFTQILEPELREGLEVVTGQSVDSGDSRMTSPFTPQFGTRRR